MADSLFENSNLSYTQIVGLLHNFAKEMSITKAAISLELSKRTVCLWYKRIREEVIGWWMRQLGAAVHEGCPAALGHGR